MFASLKPDLCSTYVIFQLYAISCYTRPRYIKNHLYLKVIDRAAHNFPMKNSFLDIGLDTQRLYKITHVGLFLHIICLLIDYETCELSLDYRFRQ